MSKLHLVAALTVAVFALALGSSFARPVSAQFYGAVATVEVAAAPGSWTPANLNGQLVYIYCPAGCSGSVDLAGIAPASFYGADIYYVLPPVAATTYASSYAAPAVSYAAPVTYTAPYASYVPYSVGVSPYSYGYSVAPFATGCTFACGFASGFQHHFGNHANESGETEPVCPAGQHESEHSESCH